MADTPMMAPSGMLEYVPEENIAARKQAGYIPATPQQISDFEQRENDSEFNARDLAALPLKAGEALSFGLSSRVLANTGLVPAEQQKAIERGAPVLSGVGTAAGILAPAIASGGAALLGRGAAGAAGKAAAMEATGAAPEALAAARAAAQAGAARAATAQGLAGALDLSAPALISKAGQAVERGLVGPGSGLLSKAAAAGAGSAVEGAFWGTGQVLTEQALGDPDLTAESAAAEIGLSALLGGALGVTGKLGGAALEHLSPMERAGGLLGSVRDRFVEKYPEWASKLNYSKDPEAFKQLMESRHLITRNPFQRAELEKSLLGSLEDTQKEFNKVGKVWAEINNTERQALIKEHGLDPKLVLQETDELLGKIDSGIAEMSKAAELDPAGPAGAMVKRALERRAALMKGTLIDTTGASKELASVAKQLGEYEAPLTAMHVKAPSQNTIIDLLGMSEDLGKASIGELGAVRGEVLRIVNELPTGVVAKAMKKEYGVLSQRLMNVAKVLEDPNPVKVMDAFGSFKKDMNRIIGAERDVAGNDATILARRAAQQVHDAVQESLYKPQVWGEVGSRMSAVAHAQEDALMAARRLTQGGSLEKVFHFDPNQGIHGTLVAEPAKIRRLLNNIYEPQGERTLAAMGEYLGKMNKYMEEFKKSYTSVPMKEIDTEHLTSVINKTGKVVEDNRKRATATKLMNELNTSRMGSGAGPVIGAGRSDVGALAAPAVGHLLGGAPGTAIGTLFSLHRFAKNAPAVVNTLVALEKAAQATAKAVDVSAGVLVRGSRKAANVGRGYAAAGVAKVLGEDKEKQKSTYDKRMAQVRALSTSPELLHEHVTQLTEGMNEHAPQTALALQAVTARAVYALMQAAEQPMPKGMLQKPHEPSAKEVADFNRLYEVINDPPMLLKQAAAGTMTMATVRAVQSVHPALFAKMQDAVLEHMAKNKDPMSVNNRAMIGMLLGVDLDGSIQQKTFMNNQSIFAFSAQAQQGGKPGPKPSPKGGKLNVADRMLTPVGRVTNPK